MISADSTSNPMMLEQGNGNVTRKMNTNNTKNNGSNNSRPLHQGKWTPEEEEYVEALISEFRAGQMPLAEGTSLRIFLSKMLNCCPMRISKKFVGTNYNGKQPYVRLPNTMAQEEVLDRRAKLRELEQKFLKRVQFLSIGGASSLSNSTKSLPTTGKEQIAVSGLSASFARKAGQQQQLQQRANPRAAACGRALLQGPRSDNLESSMKSTSADSLNQVSSSELFAELRRRQGLQQQQAKPQKNAFAQVSSCSSLGDMVAELQQRAANSDDLLGHSFNQNFSAANFVDPALEQALQNLSSVSREDLSSFQQHFERHNSINSLSDDVLFQALRSSGSFFNQGANSSSVVKDNLKNWSSAPQPGPKASCSSFSDFMKMSNSGLDLDNMLSSFKPSDLRNQSFEPKSRSKAISSSNVFSNSALAEYLMEKELAGHGGGSNHSASLNAAASIFTQDGGFGGLSRGLSMDHLQDLMPVGKQPGRDQELSTDNISMNQLRRLIEMQQK